MKDAEGDIIRGLEVADYACGFVSCEIVVLYLPIDVN